jgi:hypothetical protein
MSRRFQFSLRALLLNIGVAAVALGLMTQVPERIASPLLAALTILLVAVVAIELVYGRDDNRPFYIGAAIPLTFSFIYTSLNARWYVGDSVRAFITEPTPEIIELEAMADANQVLGMAIVAAVVLGYFCVFVRLGHRQ